MDYSKAILLAASGLFAVIPGLTSLLSGIGTPPGEKDLFGGLSMAVGVSVLLLFFINRQKIKNVPYRRFNYIAIALIAGAVICTLIYKPVLDYCSISYIEKVKEGGSTMEMATDFFFPIITDGQLQFMITKAGSRVEAANRFGPDAVSNALDKDNNPLYVALSRVLLVILYCFLSAALTSAFCLLSFRAQWKKK